MRHKWGSCSSKGIVTLASDLAEQPHTQTIVQRVGRRWTLEDGAKWGLVFRRSDMVVLGAPDMPSDTELEEAFSLLSRVT